MATALQVFYNLGSLVSTVDEVVTKVRDNLTSSVQEALDPNTLSQAQPNTGRKPEARTGKTVFPYTVPVALRLVRL